MFNTIGYVMLNVMMHTNRIHGQDCGYILPPQDSKPIPLNVCFNANDKYGGELVDYVSISCNSTLDESYTRHYGANDTTCAEASISTDTQTSLTANNYSYHCSDTLCPYYHMDVYSIVDESDPTSCEQGAYHHTKIGVIDHCSDPSDDPYSYTFTCTSSLFDYSKFTDGNCTVPGPYTVGLAEGCKWNSFNKRWNTYGLMLDVLHCDAPDPTTLPPTANPTKDPTGAPTVDAPPATTDVETTESDSTMDDSESGVQIGEVDISKVFGFITVMFVYYY
eukprot:80231_1